VPDVVEVIVTVLGLVGLAIPALAVSKRRRLMKHIVDESAALKAIDDPKAKRSMQRALRRSTANYLALTTEPALAKAKRAVFTVGFPVYLLGGVALVVSRYADELTSTDRARDYVFWISMGVACLSIVVFTSLTIWYFAAQVDNVRRRKQLERAEAEAEAAQRQSEELASSQVAYEEAVHAAVEKILARLPVATQNALVTATNPTSVSGRARDVLKRASDRDAQIMHYLREGKTPSEIAQALGLTTSRVQQLIQGNIVRRASRGESTLTIARELGIPSSRVHMYLSRAGAAEAASRAPSPRSSDSERPSEGDPTSGS
jgi:predicted transcriptional regulator